MINYGGKRLTGDALAAANGMFLNRYAVFIILFFLPRRIFLKNLT
jgi:hypothetical protein